jgi:hypothetical protein
MDTNGAALQLSESRRWCIAQHFKAGTTTECMKRTFIFVSRIVDLD